MLASLQVNLYQLQSYSLCYALGAMTSVACARTLCKDLPLGQVA